MLNSLTEQSGGGVRFWSIAREMANRGHSLFFLERTIAENYRRRKEGIQYRSSKEIGVLWLDILRATWLNLFHGLVFRPKYVFALKPLPNTCIPAILLKYIFKCKIILDVDDLEFEYYPYGFRRRLIRFFFRLFPSHFDLITTHNPYLKSLIVDTLGISPERVHFLFQGIESERFVQAHPNRYYKRKWFIEPHEKVLVYCASLGITSDFEYVLPMLIELLRSRQEIKVLVIGNGIRRPYFASQVRACGLQERMIFTGYIPHDDMPGVLKLARVGINYMAPTRANRCRASIKLREYLAAGLNVVCNPVGDAELFGSYVTLCSRMEDFPGAIGQAIEARDQDKVREAQKLLERNYSWPRLIEDFLVNPIVPLD